MYTAIETSRIKENLRNGVVFRAYNIKHPQVASVKIGASGELEEFRSVKHPSGIGEMGEAHREELKLLLEALGGKAVLLISIGHTAQSALAVQVITDLSQDGNDSIIQEEINGGHYFTLSSATPPLEVASIPAYNRFSRAHGIDGGAVIVNSDGETPIVRILSASKIGCLRISEKNATNGSKAYVILENDEGKYSCIYHRSLPVALQNALGSDMDAFIGKYLTFSFRSISRWNERVFGNLIIKHEITFCSVSGIRTEPNGELLGIR